jgi:hypothetical protein
MPLELSKAGWQDGFDLANQKVPLENGAENMECGIHRRVETAIFRR